jgi:hypothetical protein
MRFVMEPPDTSSPEEEISHRPYRVFEVLTIIHRQESFQGDPSALALAVLGWVLEDDRRAQRFLDLTGLTPEGLRAALLEETTHRAVFDFLAAHEPDLLGASAALGVAPQTILAAQEALSQ